jgi:plasmid stabilization system protein ParE
MKRRIRPGFYLDVAAEELWLMEHAGAEIADRWHDALLTTLEFLEKHPLIGRERRDLKHKDIRSWRIKGFERWLIFYGVQDDTLVLYRVVSGTMNLFKLRLD